MELKRTLGFWTLVAYGVGDILGAGIYALIGKIAGIAGAACWVGFLVAMVVAGITALSYAELGGRFPKSGGEAYFAQQGFGSEALALLVGWMVLASGVVSMATVSRGFAGYLQGLLPNLPIAVAIGLFLSALTVINFLGMRQASGANLICTGIELTGLLLVIIAGVSLLGRGAPTPPATVGPEIPATAIMQAGALAFFAFIGFEDMVNVSEEVKTPERTMPRAILTALAIAGAIYLVIAWLAVKVVPPAELAASAAPLLEVVKRGALPVPVALFTLIALFAVANTALLNFVMGSRLIYGMAQQGLVPQVLGRVHKTRRTPHIAIGVIFIVALVTALSGELAYLAGTTSMLLLVVFTVVNISLVAVKRRGGGPSTFRVPVVVPLLGACTSLGLLTFVPPRAFVTGAIIIGVGVALVGIRAVTRRN